MIIRRVASLRQTLMRRVQVRQQGSAAGFPTSFNHAKWRRVYPFQDFDRKGYVNGSNDFATWGEMSAKKVGVELDDEAKKCWVTAGQKYFGDTKSYDEWVEYMVEFVKNYPNYIEISEQLNIEMFKGIDLNKDGVVSLDEYKALVTSVFPDLSDDDIQYGFDMIDENKDGVLSQSEVSIAWARYYFDGDDTKYRHFYGKWDEEI
mmetsp:Transcript_17202/g.28129  ORF Transcript_17202/g.28129 Transcript_17202/m.28129 type:complete len:204 (+) Transcript_17202:104-715(+)|eukprot:scaffold5662_cov132-Skeletonema_menzelii.AAC.1